MAWDLAADDGGFIVIEVPALQLFSPSGWLHLSELMYRIFPLAETHRSRQIAGKLSDAADNDGIKPTAVLLARQQAKASGRKKAPGGAFYFFTLRSRQRRPPQRLHPPGSGRPVVVLQLQLLRFPQHPEFRQCAVRQPLFHFLAYGSE